VKNATAEKPVVEDYRALHSYDGPQAEAYDSRRFETLRGRLVSDLEWRLVFRGLSALMARTGRLTNVVDIPAGTGRMTIRLKRSGLRVIAVDASADMLAIAQDRGAADEYQVGRIERLSELVTTADCVVSLRLFGHLPIEVKTLALREVREVARFGAVICFAADTPWLRLRRALQARRGRTLAGWTPLSDARACDMAREAGFEVVRVLRLLGPISETHALVLHVGPHPESVRHRAP
jgi:SAM-dependent methyltransferase